MTYKENQTTPVSRTRDIDLEPYEEEKVYFPDG
jgi:hypothetical protein